MAEQLINVATETSVEDVKTSIGATGNTGGTSSSGSIFAKLNKIIADLASHISAWTSTRAGYIDTINTNAARLTSARATKIDNIGATGDTGGTASAGTIMGKLNAIITKLSGSLTTSGWYAKYGKTDTIATKTNWVKTSSETNAAFNTAVITLDAPESGTYYWELNNCSTGASLTANGTDNNLTGSKTIYIYVGYDGIQMGWGDGTWKAQSSPSAQVASKSVTTGTGTASFSGYIFAHKGQRIAIRMHIQSYGGYYAWGKCANAYIKCTKAYN